MAERLVRLVLRRRRVVLVISLLVLVAASASLSRIGFDNTVETWFLDGDPDLAVYDHFGETFNGDQLVVVGVFAADVFAPAVLDAVDRISNAAAELRFAERVQSITASPAAAPAFTEAGFREAGIGRHLMELGEAWAQERGLIDVILNVSSMNETAINMYESLGYEIEAQRYIKKLET